MLLQCALLLGMKMSISSKLSPTLNITGFSIFTNTTNTKMALTDIQPKGRTIYSCLLATLFVFLFECVLHRPLPFLVHWVIGISYWFRWRNCSTVRNVMNPTWGNSLLLVLYLFAIQWNTMLSAVTCFWLRILSQPSILVNFLQIGLHGHTSFPEWVGMTSLTSSFT